jgi:predicted dehydrogenase
MAVTVKHNLPSLGRLIAINGLWTLYKSLDYFSPPDDWRRSSSTGGPTLINFIHEVDLLHYWYGPIVRVYAEPTLKQRGFDADEGAAITLRFQSGMVGTFLLSDAVPSPYHSQQKDGPDFPLAGKDFHCVFGEQGSLAVPYFVRWDYGEEERDWRNEIHGTKLEVPKMRDAFTEQVEHFVRVIRGEEQPRCDGIEGLRAVMVCEAVRRSMREGKPVEIAQDGEV